MNIITFDKRYNNVKKVELDENFRCNKNIVKVANEVIKNNNKRLLKNMKSNIESDKKVKGIGFNSEEEQYEYIANNIKWLHQNGIEYKDIAILVRKGKYIERINFILNKYDIPFITDCAEYFFNSIYFEKFIETLKLLSNYSKDELFNIWNNFIDMNNFEFGFKYLRRIVNSNVISRKNKLSDILTEFLNIVRFLDESYEDFQLRMDCYNGIRDILDDYDEIYNDYQLTARVNGLIDFFEYNAVEQYKYHNFKDKDFFKDSIQIMTVHKAKGLEFNTVFLPNMGEGDFPARKINRKCYWHVLSGKFEEEKEKYETDVEDERKLFYVAVTRAKENLFISYNLSKFNVSRFIVEASKCECFDVNKGEISKYSFDNQGEIEMESNIDIKLIKEELYNYYFNANHYCKGIIFEYEDLLRKGNEAVMQKAKELSII